MDYEKASFRPELFYERMVAEYVAGDACVAQKANGMPCLGQALPANRFDAWPWPLCHHHHDQVERVFDRRVEAIRDYHRQRAEQAEARSAEAIRLATESAHVVYFVQRQDRKVKIGYTSNLTARLSALRSDHGPLVILGLARGGEPLEAAYHKELRRHRVGVTEWFRPTKAVLAAAAEARYTPPTLGHGRGAWRLGLFGAA